DLTVLIRGGLERLRVDDQAQVGVADGEVERVVLHEVLVLPGADPGQVQRAGHVRVGRPVVLRPPVHHGRVDPVPGPGDGRGRVDDAGLLDCGAVGRGDVVAELDP